MLVTYGHSQHVIQQAAAIWPQLPSSSHKFLLRNYSQLLLELWTKDSRNVSSGLYNPPCNQSHQQGQERFQNALQRQYKGLNSSVIDVNTVHSPSEN